MQNYYPNFICNYKKTYFLKRPITAYFRKDLLASLPIFTEKQSPKHYIYIYRPEKVSHFSPYNVVYFQNAAFNTFAYFNLVRHLL